MGEVTPTVLTKSEAEALTSEIVQTAEDFIAGYKRFHELTAQAHEGQIWVPLGLPSFDAWLSETIRRSRTSGYRLLVQDLVVRELESAAGVELEVSQRASLELLPALGAVSAEVARVTKGVSKKKRGPLVSQLVTEWRLSSKTDGPNGTPGDAEPEVIEATATDKAFPAAEDPEEPTDVPRGTSPDQPKDLKTFEPMDTGDPVDDGADPQESDGTIATNEPEPEAGPEPEPGSPETVGSSVLAALLASDPVAEAMKDSSAKGLKNVKGGRGWLDTYEMQVKGVASLKTPAGAEAAPSPDGAAMDIGEAATIFLRALKAVPAASHSVKVWEQFNRDLASKSFEAINAKTTALKGTKK